MTVIIHWFYYVAVLCMQVSSQVEDAEQDKASTAVAELPESDISSALEDSFDEDNVF